MTQLEANLKRLKIRKKNQMKLIESLQDQLTSALNEDERIDTEIKELMTKEVGGDNQ